MEGEISVDSKLGEGSLFHVELPVELSTEKIEISNHEATMPIVIGLKPDQPRWRILVVEDNADNRLLLTSLLTRVGFDTREAENGVEAVAQFQQWQPHFIWMDMRMPVMSGYEATAKIRELADNKDVKIVALTASVFKEERRKILATGCDEVVCKPFLVHAIFDTMAKQLGVRYHYQESSGITVGVANEIQAEAILELPVEVRQALKMAAVSLNKIGFEAALVQIPAQQLETSRGLSKLANEFRFDLILKLLDSAETGSQ
jgi:CheY-like chemotaxis protein